MKTKPWLSERNYYQWMRNGLLCEIRRANFSGHLNGYVALPKNHPLTGIDYNTIHDLLPDMQVHGGLTFCTQSNYAKSEGHKPYRINGMAWTFGFDCAHLNDYCPKLDETLTKVMETTNHSMHPSRNVYRDVVYVRQQVNNLADQLYNYREAT